MGQLTLPPLTPASRIYFDTNPFIYSIERVEPFRSILLPLWESVARSGARIVTSELSLLEVLVGPIKAANVDLQTEYRRLLTSEVVQLAPITRDILLKAAELRAAHRVKTPDAIYAATFVLTPCSHFVTFDTALKSILGRDTVLDLS